jgi:hypothetical protein
MISSKGSDGKAAEIMTGGSKENYIKPGNPIHARRRRPFRELGFDNFAHLVPYLTGYLPDGKASHE